MDGEEERIARLECHNDRPYRSKARVADEVRMGHVDERKMGDAIHIVCPSTRPAPMVRAGAHTLPIFGVLDDRVRARSCSGSIKVRRLVPLSWSISESCVL